MDKLYKKRKISGLASSQTSVSDSQTSVFPCESNFLTTRAVQVSHFLREETPCNGRGQAEPFSGLGEGGPAPGREAEDATLLMKVVRNYCEVVLRHGELFGEARLRVCSRVASQGK
jgi:hypothetical protein